VRPTGLRVLQIVRLAKPIGNRRLDLVAVADVDDVRHFRRRPSLDAPHLRRADGAAEKHAQLEGAAPRAHEEVARCAREHDRRARRVDSLIAEFDRGFAQAVVGVTQVFGQVGGQRRFGGGPAVVRRAFRDPLLAVVALVAPHTREL
jgi:hypothetical protein